MRNNFHTLYLPLFWQLCRFGIIGICAAGVHFSLVVLLVQMTNMLPLIANACAFLISFQCSYWGHRLWTFQHTQALHRTALPRLLTIQVFAFAANETLFYILLKLNLPYPIALLIVLMILPVFTFVTSKFWAFRSSF